jgi:hypothetical protein
MLHCSPLPLRTFALCLLLPAAATSCRNGGVSLETASCDDIVRIDSLPSVLREASGIDASTAHAGVLWVHNDGSNAPLIFALDTLAHLRGRVRIDSPFRNMDWEDIAVANCGDHDCIYIADIGDNRSTRPFVRVLRIDEPDPAKDSVARPVAFPFRYPDGPHDAEAIFVLPGERLFVITKGRNAPVALFRYPGKLRADTVTLTHVRDFTPGLVQIPGMVTGADAASDGSRVVVRTYSFLYTYTPSGTDRDGGDGRDGRDGRGSAADDLRAIPPDSLSLAGAHEFQGEGVALRDDGRIFLVAEQGFDTVAPPLSSLFCH